MPMNMAHCRFENTLAALEECDEALSDGVRPLERLNEREQKAARKLIKLCREMGEWELGETDE